MPERGWKMRSDKKIRVNAGLSQDTHDKLEKLSFAISQPKTVLAADLIEICVNNPGIIEYVQKIYQAKDDRRIIPIVENGKVTY